MPMVGSGDDYRVHIRARQHLAIVARAFEHAIAPNFLGVDQASLVDVAHRHQFHAARREGGAGVAASLDSIADQRDPDPIVGRDALRGLGQ